MKAIGSRTRLVGLIAADPSHSLSPALHNAAFRTHHMDWAYLPLRVPDLASLPAALRGLAALSIVGVNITRPYKEAAFHLVDERTPEAERIGAVNTLRVGDAGQLIGHNTDAQGLYQALGATATLLKQREIIVLGAGGAARAVVETALDAGASRIALFNRHGARARALADSLHKRSEVEIVARSLDRLPESIGPMASPAWIVNATCLGDAAHPAASPWPSTLSFPATARAIDLVYGMGETPFLAKAQEHGAPCIDGLPMLVHQAALSFAFWTGHAPPVEVMSRVLEVDPC